MNILDQDTLREKPPRYLGLFTCIKVLFGGPYIQFASIFFWCGIGFVLGFTGRSEMIHWFSFDGEWVETEGLLLEINETNGSMNEERIYEYVFSYNVNGESFTGKSNESYNEVKEGSLVQIEYKDQNLIRSRMVGTRSEIFPSSIALFVLLFPIIGFYFLFVGFKKNIKIFFLLKNGIFTRGKMISSKVAADTSIDDRTLYAYEFEFHANNKIHLAKCKTHLKERVEDEETEKILYNKNNPSFNLVYDAIGNIPEIDRFGNIKQSNVLALSLLLITLIGLLVNGLIFKSMYL